jgi:hypothetical protein
MNLHIESVRSAQTSELPGSSTLSSDKCRSRVMGRSSQEGRDLEESLIAESSGETDHIEAERVELAEDVGIKDEGHTSEVVEMESVPHFQRPTYSVSERRATLLLKPYKKPLKILRLIICSVKADLDAFTEDAYLIITRLLSSAHLLTLAIECINSSKNSNALMDTLL